MSLVVNEIFYSIQGESSYAGRPCVFIRLTGCNLRCSWCDTPYAYDEGTSLSGKAILDRVESYGCPLVEITGGEPLLQAETPALIRRLIDKGFQVLLETNGSLDVSPVDGRCVKILDVKCPSSEEEGKNDFQNFERLTEQDEIKFVIGGRGDYEYARGTLRRFFPEGQVRNPVHFSPLAGRMDPALLARWILEDRLPVRLQLPIHKILWPDGKRGV